MTKAAWYSEPFPAGGGISAEGVRNQLGRPSLSPLEVLVREAIQNSWDARDGDAQVRFAIAGWEPDPEQRDFLSELIGATAPEDPLPLRRSLQKQPIRLLAICDRGTTGLGGPTRADVYLPGQEAHDFVAFIRNVGEPSDKEHSAGTFGFGKSVFYAVSNACTILAYTRCRSAGRPETRLIGCAVSDSFKRRDESGVIRPYTGRHWWGVLTRGVVEPLLDDEAEHVATQLGLEKFREKEFGTTVLIIDPTFNDPLGDMRGIAEAIVWHTWPRLLSHNGAPPPLHCVATWNGRSLEIPDPATTPPIDAFVTAYRGLTRNGELVECRRPQQGLGRLSLHRRLRRLRVGESPAGFAPPIASPVHHVALLRTPGFVVKYYAGPPLLGDTVEYAGVFQASDDVDSSFAAAEPPAHDDWIAKQLRGVDRTFVNTFFARLDERLRDFSRPRTAEIVGTSRVALGEASSLFASLVATATATGASPVANDGAGGSRAGPGAGAGSGGEGGGVGSGRGGRDGHPPRGRVQDAGEPGFGEFADKPALLFPFRVPRAPDGAVIEVQAHVGVDEGGQAEGDGPSGAPHPRVLGFVGPEGERVSALTLAADGRHGEVWRVAVAPAPDTTTTVTFGVREAGR